MCPVAGASYVAITASRAGEAQHSTSTGSARHERHRSTPRPFPQRRVPGVARQRPDAFLDENAPEGLTAEQVLAAMPGVCAALPPEQAESLRTAYGLVERRRLGGRLGVAAGPAAASTSTRRAGRPGRLRSTRAADPVEQVLQQLNYYTTVVNTTNQTFQDNDVTNIDDRDTTVDASVNQNITAFGDVNQDFDNDVVSGDGAVAAGDDAQVNTGDGAVQAGGDIEDSNVVTGDVERLGPGRRHQRLGRGRRQPGHLRLDRRRRHASARATPPTSRPRTPCWATARWSTAATATSP